MPVISNRISTAQLAAGLTVENALADSAYEFLPFNAMVQVSITEDTQNDDIRMTIIAGSDTLMEEGAVSQQNRFPTEEDLLMEEALPAGTRLKIRLRNIDGANATSARLKVNLIPI